MDLNNLKACIDHDEATIQSFMRNPDYAEYYLQAVLADRDNEEISEVQSWYDEAKKRTQTLEYWASVTANAKLAAKSGYNLTYILNALNEAVTSVKAAMA